MSHCMYMHTDMYWSAGLLRRLPRGSPMNDINPEISPEPEGTPDSAEERLPTSPRPLGFWLRAVDALISREFDTAFADEGATRRDWMLLNALARTVDAPDSGQWLARKGKHLRGLEKRGWADEAGDGTWVLTDEGRAALERLGGVVDGIRRRVADTVAPDDFATTMTTLEAIARELGWDENSVPMRGGFGRGFGRDFGRGFGPGFRPGFGRDFGPGFRAGHEHHHGYDHGHGFEHGPEFAHGRGHGYGYGYGRTHSDEPCHHEHHGRGHGRGSHKDDSHTEHAYERGFDAGFRRGQHA